MKTLLGPIVVTACLAAPIAAEDRPYAGQDDRAVASLSAADVSALLAGEGWGFAKPAELNGYPGPAHLLDLGAALDLTADQREAIEAIFEAMNAEARRLGADYVAAEAALDRAFARGEIDGDRVRTLTAEAAAIEADLRATHLAAHLQVTPLLTRHQIATYAKLRGYGDAGGGHGGH